MTGSPKVLVMAAALLTAAPLHAQKVSTAAPAAVPAAPSAPAVPRLPLFLTFSKDSYSSKVGLDYSVRWDFSDLRSFRPGLGFLISSIRTLYHWDITENTRLDYYGFRTNPWRLVITKDKKKGRAPAAAGAGGDGAADGGADSPVITRQTPEYRKRLRLSISPLVDDLKRNFDENMSDFLLRSSLKGVTPEWQKAGRSGRQAFVKDVLAIGIWDTNLPVLKQTGKGLEYLEGKQVKKSTVPAEEFKLPEGTGKEPERK